MAHELQDYGDFTETKDGEYSALMSRDEFRDFVGDMEEFVSDHASGKAKTVRADRRNPVVKYDTGRVYLKYEDGNGFASFKMASSELEERFMEMAMGGGSSRHRGGSSDEGQGGAGMMAERGGSTGTSGVSGADMAGKALGMGESGGMGEVHKPFTKDESDYKDPGQDGFDETHMRCRGCAHYDNHGNCRIVPDINPDGYCGEFYADVGFFGHSHGHYVEHNLTLGGESYEWNTDDAEDFATAVREAIEAMARGR